MAQSVESVIVAVALLIGVVFGVVGSAVGGTTTQLGADFYLLSSVGLMIGALVLAAEAIPRGDALLVAGLISYAIGEGLVVTATSEAGFTQGVAFYVPAFLLLGISNALPIWSRLAGVISAVLWAIYVVMSLTGSSVTSSGGLATGGYIFLSIAVLGWIWWRVTVEPRSPGSAAAV